MFWWTASAVPRYQTGAELLLRRDDFDELAELAAQVAPAALHVLDERLRLVLGEDRDLADAGVDAVRQHEIDDAELAAERASPACSGARSDRCSRSPRPPAMMTASVPPVRRLT